MPNKSKLLIVDDEPSNLKILNAALKDEYDISVATDGRQALELINKAPKKIDLILLDIVMPSLNGYELCLTLKSQKPTKDIPIIFITGKTTQESEAKAFEVGAVDYISKPFNLPVVQARVTAQVNLKLHTDLLRRLLADQTVKLRQYQDEYMRLFHKTSS